MVEIDVQMVADYIVEVADYDERYEDDCFCVDLCEVRWFVERKRNFFILHVGDEVLKLPRF